MGTPTTDRTARTPGDGRRRGRLLLACALGVVMVPLLAVGVIDPLEGGLPLIAGIALAAAVRVLSGLPIPRLAWISALVALAFAVAVILLGVSVAPEKTPSNEAGSPIQGGTRLLLYGYWLAGLATVAGAVVHVVRVFRLLSAR